MDKENRLVVAEREAVDGGMEQDVGLSRCKLLYTEQKNSKVLLYSTGIYNQYHMINHNGTEYKKACIYTYNWGTWLYSRNKYDIVNQLYFN